MVLIIFMVLIVHKGLDEKLESVIDVGHEVHRAVFDEELGEVERLPEPLPLVLLVRLEPALESHQNLDQVLPNERVVGDDEKIGRRRLLRHGVGSGLIELALE